MSSYISHFKWLGIAVVGFIAIELTINWLAPTPEAVRNNFLELAFAKPERVQRAFVYEKVQQLDNEKPDVLQVGDSSGLHGVQPLVVESYIGGRYLNMSVATNLGFWGYYALAEHFMQRSGSVKALVLYIAPPGAYPRRSLIDAKDLMADDLEREFADPIRGLFHVPSLGLRKQVTDFIYYMDGTFNQPNRPLIDNDGYLMLRNIVKPSGGWARETDDPGDIIPANILDNMRREFPALAHFDDNLVIASALNMWGHINDDRAWDWSTLSYKTYMEVVLDRYLRLAKRYGAKLVVVTNPVPEIVRRTKLKDAFHIETTRVQLDRYAKHHPEVALLNIHYWPDDRFSVFAHVGVPYAIDNSAEIGKFLASVLGQKARRVDHAADVAEVTDLDMGKNPTVYSFGAVEHQNGRAFRSIRPGRDEALAFARMAPQGPVDVSIKVLNQPGSPVLRKLSLAVFGVPATRLADEPTGDGTVVRFRLSAAIVRRYDGWLEMILSTRGAPKWVSNALLPDATGPQLMVERLELKPVSEDRQAEVQ